MMNRPSLSQPGMPQDNNDQNQAPAYVVPAANQANPQGEGQPADFGDFDAVFPAPNADNEPVAAIVLAVNNEAVIDVAHDQPFADMLRMVELEEKLTKSIRANKKLDARKGIYFSSLGILITMIGAIHTLTTQNEEGNFDWSSDESNEKNQYLISFYAVLNAFIFLMLYININFGTERVKNILDSDELADLDLYTNLTGKTPAVKAIYALNDQFTNQSIRAHGALETLYLSSITQSLQKTLNAGTTAPLMPVGLAAGFAVGAMLRYNANGPTNDFWTLVFVAGAELDFGALVYFIKNYRSKNVASTLKQDQFDLAKKITLNSEIGSEKAIEGMFEFKKALTAPLTTSARRGITLFHRNERQRNPLVVAQGEVEMQLRRA